MTKKIMACAFLAMWVLFISGPLQAQATEAKAKRLTQSEVTELEAQSAQAFADGEPQKALDINLELHQQRPFIQSYMIDIVRAAALLDNKSLAYEHMLKMQRQGLSYDFNQTEDTLNIRKTELYGYLNDLMIEALKPAGEAMVQFTLAGDPADFRAIAWDNSRDSFLVGTASKGQVLAVTMDGEVEVLLQADDGNGLWAVTGLFADEGRNRLWVSSAAIPEFSGFKPGQENQGGLFEFNLESLELLGTYLIPVDPMRHELGSIAVSDEGHVYIVDRGTPIVYRKVPDADRIEAFVGSPELVSFSDIAVAPDNSRLFVSDAVKGIFVVDPVAQQASMLTGPPELNLGGIGGIEYSMGHLFLVQGGMEPQRLMRLKLDGTGSGVESVSPMAVAIGEFNKPGVVTQMGGQLYYFANAGEENSEAGSIVMRTAMDAGNEIVPPDMRKLQQTIREKQLQKQQEKEQQEKQQN